MAVLASCAPLVASHNWMTFPTPRNNKDGPYGSGAGEDNNCETSSTTMPSGNTFQRGQTIKPRWVWNNHWNGFARFSIVPLGKEGDKATMNDPENFSAFLALLLLRCTDSVL